MKQRTEEEQKKERESLLIIDGDKTEDFTPSDGCTV